MAQEIDLLTAYPRTKRDVHARASEKTEHDRAIARQFGAEFFDGERRHGYGGFTYHPRFWQPVVPAFREHFNLSCESSVLDVGCAKGFMMRDFAAGIPGITARGVDISQYAIDHVLEDMKPYVQVANATKLPFADKSFDVVISINTVHNLAKDELAQALGEISRVSRRGAYVTVDAYHDDDEDERERMMAWNLTAKTIMSVGQWKAFFAEIGYEGDYFWFIP
jgi:SAM-dependent methyltransferase